MATLILFILCEIINTLPYPLRRRRKEGRAGISFVASRMKHSQIGPCKTCKKRTTAIGSSHFFHSLPPAYIMDFTVNLAKTIELKVQWVVCLCEIIYPGTWG